MQRAVALYTIAAVCTLCSYAAYGQEGASTVLTESTFERLTQAAGGQTAGIWCDEMPYKTSPPLPLPTSGIRDHCQPCLASNACESCKKRLKC